MPKLKEVIGVIRGEFTVRLDDKPDAFGKYQRQSAIYHEDLKKFDDFEVFSISSGIYDVGSKEAPLSEPFITIILEDRK